MEIHLRETADLVDHYFIVEATITHKGEEKPILWERLRLAMCCLDCQMNTIALHHRFTERFSFLKEDQVIHVVVDQLGDNEAHRGKSETATDWWVFILLTLRGGFYFPGGLRSSKPRLASRGSKTGLPQRILDWTTLTYSSAAMQMRFSISTSWILTPWSYVSGSQSIFAAQPGALSTIQRYSHRSTLDANGRPHSSISYRLDGERSTSLLSHALHLYLDPGS